MINVGIDWAEDTHQVCLVDIDGARLDEFVIRDGAIGVRPAARAHRGPRR